MKQACCRSRGVTKTQIFFFLPAKITAPFAGTRKRVTHMVNSLWSPIGLSRLAGILTTRTSSPQLRLTGESRSRLFKTPVQKPHKRSMTRTRRSMAKTSLLRHNLSHKFPTFLFQRLLSGSNGHAALLSASVVESSLLGWLKRADRKSTRLNSSHFTQSRMPSSA